MVGSLLLWAHLFLAYAWFDLSQLAGVVFIASVGF